MAQAEADWWSLLRVRRKPIIQFASWRPCRSWARLLIVSRLLQIEFQDLCHVHCLRKLEKRSLGQFSLAERGAEEGIVCTAPHHPTWALTDFMPTEREPHRESPAPWDANQSWSPLIDHQSREANALMLRLNFTSKRELTRYCLWMIPPSNIQNGPDWEIINVMTVVRSFNLCKVRMNATSPHPRTLSVGFCFYPHPADEGTETWRLSTQWTTGPALPCRHPVRSPGSPPLGSALEAHVKNDIILHRGNPLCGLRGWPAPRHSEGDIVDFLSRHEPWPAVCTPMRELRIEILCTGKEKKRKPKKLFFPI